MIERCRTGEEAAWLDLRAALWPECPLEQHRIEIAAMAARPDTYAAFIACGAGHQALGFAEAALRAEYVNGTHSSPVAFLEGLYVVPAARRRGLARELVAAVVRWAADLRCSELASDASIDNDASLRAHRALGFTETERVVFFRRSIA